MAMYPTYSGFPMTTAGGGPFGPHPQYVFQYRFPQFAVTPQVQQNLLRPTAKGCGPQGRSSACQGAANYPLTQFNPVAQIGRLGRMLGFGEGEGPGIPTGLPVGMDMTGNPVVPPGVPFDPTPVSEIGKQLSWQEEAAGIAWGVATVAGTALGAYHGYKRNNSIGWGIAWAVLGGLFPVVTVPVAIAQGFGKRKGR